MKLFCYYQHVNNDSVMFYPTRLGDRHGEVTVYIGYWVNSTSKAVLHHDILEVRSDEEEQWITKD